MVSSGKSRSDKSKRVKLTFFAFRFKSETNIDRLFFILDKRSIQLAISISNGLMHYITQKIRYLEIIK